MSINFLVQTHLETKINKSCPLKDCPNSKIHVNKSGL